MPVLTQAETSSRATQTSLEPTGGVVSLVDGNDVSKTGRMKPGGMLSEEEDDGARAFAGSSGGAGANSINNGLADNIGSEKSREHSAGGTLGLVRWSRRLERDQLLRRLACRVEARPRTWTSDAACCSGIVDDGITTLQVEAV
ncbi:hypothetical protein M0R45_002828 [Rubus argutus]|uniref:Uncharacterized protein n=1 Tax=Rubus argutus TaxID=59490 RepID=A0AAW1VQ38_RUBAR